MSRAATTVGHKTGVKAINGAVKRQRSKAETVLRRNESPGNFDMEKLFCRWPQKSAHVITELLTTEKGYIESLEEIIQGYLKPLYEHLFSASQGSKFIKTIFCNLQKLHKIHLDLYFSLISSYESPSEFGNVFIANRENFREYTQYCTNFPKCEELLQQVMKSEPNTRDFIIQCQLDLGHPLPLITYLHKPVQRILKYRLLLEQALKSMSDGLEGFTEMKSALDVMSDVALEINEVKRKYENSQRVESIQKSLKGLKSAGLHDGNLKSCGSLVFEEKCKVLGSFGGERIMMLFETCLLFLRDRGSQKYTYKWHILVEELDVCAVSSNVFKVFSVYKPSQKLSVEVKTSALKDKIVNQIQSVLVKDLKKQQSIRASLKKAKKEQDRKSTNLAYERSLLASELQSRRRAKQTSTRKQQKLPENKVSTTSTSNANTKDNCEQASMTKLLTESSKEERKLRRRTAVRRKETSRGHQMKRASISGVPGAVEPPTTVSYSYPLDSAQWDLENSTKSFDESYREVGTGFEEQECKLDVNIESSLDKGKRTPEFLRQYSQSIDMPPDENICPEIRRPRSDGSPTPPDPSLVLKNDQISEYSNQEPGVDKEAMIWNWNSGKDQCLTLHRVSVSSRDDDNNLIEASLCSNASSLSAEDHYYLSTMANSSVIAGADGDNITIYDNDSDESEEEWEEDVEERAESQQQVYEGDVTEKSLRSFLSVAKLWGSLDEDECSISPLATLPRVSNEGIASLLRYKQKPKLLHRPTVDVIESLPPSTLSPVNVSRSSPHNLLVSMEQGDNDDDLLESFVLPLPELSLESGKHRDSWVPSDDDTSSSDPSNLCWTLQRYISEEVKTPTYKNMNEDMMLEDSQTPNPSFDLPMDCEEGLSENVVSSNGSQAEHPLLDSGFQSVSVEFGMNLEEMIAVASEIRSQRDSNGYCSNKSFRSETTSCQKLPVKENIYVGTMEAEQSAAILEDNQTSLPLALKGNKLVAGDCKLSTTSSIPNPLNTDSLHKTSTSKCLSKPLKGSKVPTEAPTSMSLTHHSTLSSKDDSQQHQSNQLRTSFSQTQDDLLTAMLAKVTFGLVTFVPSLQQTVFVCIVACLVLCLLYFIRCYFSSSYERDTVK